MTKEQYEEKRRRLQMAIASAEQSGNRLLSARYRMSLSILDDIWGDSAAKIMGELGLPQELKVVHVEASEAEIMPVDDPQKAFNEFFGYEQK